MMGAASLIYEYRGALFPEYLRTGNASQHIVPSAQHFCRGRGVDVGAGPWPLPGAVPVELNAGGDAYALPFNGLPEEAGGGCWDYVFSSHCLEHLDDPVRALEHWQQRLRPGGVLFLYLPHPDMTYWLPQFCRKHRHQWWPTDMARLLRDLGFVNVLHSERDLAWSFACVGFKADE